MGLGFLANINSTQSPHDSTLTEWQAFMPSAANIGFSSGIGSGWGPFTGAVDNIAWTIGGVTTAANFEVQGVAAAVPEPTTLALMLSAVFGLGMARRGRRQG